MIILINGPFGAGKTSVAQALHERMPNSLIYDPEEVGALLTHIVGSIDPKDDFQSYQLWPRLVVDVALGLKQQYDRDLIIPMTIYDLLRFHQIVSNLRRIDADILHFCLMVRGETIAKRVANRTDAGQKWCFDHAAEALEAFASEEFETKLDADTTSVEELGEQILSHVEGREGQEE